MGGVLGGSPKCWARGSLSKVRVMEPALQLVEEAEVLLARNKWAHGRVWLERN